VNAISVIAGVPVTKEPMGLYWRTWPDAASLLFLGRAANRYAGT